MNITPPDTVLRPSRLWRLGFFVGRLCRMQRRCVILEPSEQKVYLAQMGT